MTLTRRTFLLGTGLLAGAVALGGGEASRPAATDPDPVARRRRFATRPDMNPPEPTIARSGATASGLLFVSPHRDSARSDALVVDDTGQPVWFSGSDRLVAEVRVQTYQGAPVLTYWEGDRRPDGGHGDGAYIVLDRSYRRIAELRAGNGAGGDFHEFTLTDRGTALIIAYPSVRADLRALGGPRDGHVYDNRVQEIDVRTGEVLLDWSALEHLDFAESHSTLADGPDGSRAKPMDPFHVNSVDDDGDTLLLSARHTHAVYAIDRDTGEIRWRLNGRRSDYTMGEQAAFTWQHDARRRPDGTITVFDNRGAPAPTTSRGIVLRLDERRRRATLVREYADGRTFGQYMGNMQTLPNGNVLLGWGSAPALTEFTADGTPVLEITGLGKGSYRAYRMPWSATPATAPDLAVTRASARGMDLHASWNGATEVASWRFWTGPAGTRLAPAATVPRTGFETSASVPRAAFAQAEALSAAGTPLARSTVLDVSTDEEVLA